jgi:AcrR family transcriptional regulator
MLAIVKLRPARKPPRNARYPGDLRRALIDAALAIVAENHGSGELTLRGAARRVGVSHAAPGKHFADKKSLLAAVGAEGLERLRNAMVKAREQARPNSRDRLIATGVAYMRFALANASHLRVMFGPDVAKADSPEFQRQAIEGFNLLKEIVVDCVGPDVAVKDVRRLGIIVLSSLHGLAELILNRQVPPSVRGDPESLARLAMETLHGSLIERARSASRRRGR